MPDSSIDDNIKVIYEYSKEKVKDVMERKRHTEIKTLYLLQATAVVSALLMAFNDNGFFTEVLKLFNIKKAFTINDGIYIGAYATLIFTIFVLVASLQDRLLHWKITRFLMNIFYDIDVEVELKVSEYLENLITKNKEELNRDLKRSEKKKLKKEAESRYNYIDSIEPRKLFEYYNQCTGDLTEFYKTVIDMLSNSVESGGLIHVAKDMWFSIGLFSFLISVLLILINSIIK